jgi:transposase
MGTIVAEVVDVGEKHDGRGRRIISAQLRSPRWARSAALRRHGVARLNIDPDAGVSFGDQDLPAVQPVDMCKEFNGLWTAAQEQLREDPKNGALFVSINKERTRLKLLYWDGTGVWVLAKRLEQGRFSWPVPGDDRTKLWLAPESFALLIGGWS